MAVRYGLGEEEPQMARTGAGVGLVGCGEISAVYLKQARSYDTFDIVACTDIDMERAKARAAEFDVPIACTVDALLANPDVEVVLNLTVPQAHADVALAALRAGKHVYNEKPLATTRQDACCILEEACARGLRVGCAPDTFLGAGLQTCRKLLDDGWIGTPVAASAFMMTQGPESWRPDPAFYYQPGLGPLFDMGPYYLTALIALIGPVRRVTSSARITFLERKITSKPLFGTMIKVNTPTHIAGLLDFESGAVGTLVTSCDVWAAEVPRLEIYGTDGTLSVPNPNMVGGPVRVRRAGASSWTEMPLAYPLDQTYARGAGLADMAAAIRSGRPHRAHGHLAFHVVDIIQAFLEASAEGRHIELTSGCPRPASLPLGLLPYEIEA
jgi:predicted dehydrogenase